MPNHLKVVTWMSTILNLLFLRQKGRRRLPFNSPDISTR